MADRVDSDDNAGRDMDWTIIESTGDEFIDACHDNNLTMQEMGNVGMMLIVEASLQSYIPYEQFLNAVRSMTRMYKDQWPIG